MKDNENSHLIDKVVDSLRKAAVEMEEFQVKAALGKAEARDKYEESKKKLNLFIHETKMKVTSGKEQMEEFHTKLDELRVQLALGKAETTEVFLEQKKKLLSLLHQIEVKIKSNDQLRRLYAILLIEIEMFKVQLEILEEKFDEGKAEAKTTFERGKKQFDTFIDEVKSDYVKKQGWNHFQEEISEAFSHLKKAFQEA